MAFGDRIRAAAKRVNDRLGTTVTISRAGVSLGTFGSSPLLSLNRSVADSSTYVLGSASVIIHAEGAPAEPAINDVVTSRGVGWRVENKQTHEAGDQIVAWTLSLREVGTDG